MSPVGVRVDRAQEVVDKVVDVGDDVGEIFANEARQGAERVGEAWEDRGRAGRCPGPVAVAMMRRRLLLVVVLGLLIAGCLPGGGEESSMDSMEADAALRQLIAETAKGSLGDREVTLAETRFGACDPAVPPEEVNLSLRGRVALREGEPASERLPAVQRYFEEQDLEIETREGAAKSVIGRSEDGLVLELIASIGDEQLSISGGSKCVKNVQPRPRAPSDEFLSDPPSSP